MWKYTEKYFSEVKDHTLHCPPAKQGNKNAVSAWVYTIGSNDNQYQIVTDQAMCRYGEKIYHEAPTCPFTACDDDYCKNFFCKPFQYY